VATGVLSNIKAGVYQAIHRRNPLDHRNGHRLGRRVGAHAHVLPASIPKEPPFTAESGGATQGRAVGDESASRNRKFESTPLRHLK
jgi:hypothetical protein